MDNDTSENSKMDKFLKDKEHHRGEFIAAVIVNIICWYIANNLLNWNLSFISPTFSDVLGILNLFLITAIIINFIFIFYNASWFRNLLSIITAILGVIVAYTFLTVFPFILNDTLALALKILLVLAIIGSFIAIIVHIMKVIYAVLNR